MWPFTAPRPELVSGSAAPPSACPVDPSARSSYLATNTTSPSPPTSRGAPPTSDTLSRDREVSSIPRWLPPKNPSSTTPASPTAEEDLPLACPARSAPAPPTTLDTSYIPTNATEAASVVDKVENWVYPSPSSFFSALERKNRDPSAPDMPVVVPIHNAVNERVWEEVLEWEKREGGSEGSKLVSFVGKPKELSLRARWKGLIGYSAPFDRHDWIVDRPLPPSPDSPDAPTSIRIRYIIDFYTGRLPAMLSPDSGRTGGREDMLRPNLSFYLDVRPAVDGFEGGRMRVARFWKGLVSEGK